MPITDADALFIADPQNDFMPGGVLAVPEGDRIFEALNPLTHRLPLVICSQDWHPENHVSFKIRGGPWPPHCVQRTPGADFHPDFDQSRAAIVLRKAFDPDLEQYSAFEATETVDMLKGRGIRRLFIGGVATDYCVLFSTLDALKGGLEAFVILDGVRAINAEPGDDMRALAKMEEAGARLISSSEVDEV